jgi:hypothetical protein
MIYEKGTTVRLVWQWPPSTRFALLDKPDSATPHPYQSSMPTTPAPVESGLLTWQTAHAAVVLEDATRDETLDKYT